VAPRTPGAPPSEVPPSENHLLAALPRAEYERLVPLLEIVRVEALETIARPDEALAHAYFPLTGIISVVALGMEGGTVEVGTVGREGMAGMHAFLGEPTSPFATLGEVPGAHARLPVRALRATAAPGTALHALLLRYAQAFTVLAGQSAACNRLHPMEERCARWLLMTHDGVRRDTFALTHEVLGQMLGVRRPSVTLAAGILQRAGLIRYHRGLVTILDRPSLEAAACECYGVIRNEFDGMRATDSGSLAAGG
jgi:CRP-like cAMP-binding protein